MDHYFTNNYDLKSEIRELKTKFNDVDFTFLSDNGVFSKNKIDFGSKLLLTECLKEKTKFKKVLDVGCGYGILGIVISKINGSFLTSVDVNKRCVHLTNKNILLNNIDGNSVVSNIYEKVEGLYDLIITNPPIRAGKEIVKEILLGAGEFLNSNGELWIVIRKDQGAKSFLKIMEEKYKIEVKNKSKGYYIIKCKK